MGQADHRERGVARSTRRTRITYVVAAVVGVAFLLALPLGNAAVGGTALQLNGSSQYATLGGSADLRSATFTVELWFQRTGAGSPTSTGTGGITNAIPLITKGRAEAENAGGRHQLFPRDRRDEWQAGRRFRGGPGWEHAEREPSDHGHDGDRGGAAWHHAAATYDGATWKLYLDGALDGTLAVGKPANAATNVTDLGRERLDHDGLRRGFLRRCRRRGADLEQRPQPGADPGQRGTTRSPPRRPGCSASGT